MTDLPADMVDQIEAALHGVPSGALYRMESFGHRFVIVPTTESGIHTGRRRYLVACTTCEALVHEASTGPLQQVGYHLRRAEEQRAELPALRSVRDRVERLTASGHGNATDAVALAALDRLLEVRRG